MMQDINKVLNRIMLIIKSYIRAYIDYYPHNSIIQVAITIVLTCLHSLLIPHLASMFQITNINKKVQH